MSRTETYRRFRAELEDVLPGEAVAALALGAPRRVRQRPAGELVEVGLEVAGEVYHLGTLEAHRARLLLYAVALDLGCMIETLEAVGADE